MTKADYTHLSIVVDRSGSMAQIKSDAEGGINTLIEEQSQQVDVGDITVTLYQFDTEYEKVFGPVAAGDAPKYELHPRGGTALLDATGRAITDTGSWLRSLDEDERPDKVIFVIVTDGWENSSHEFTKEQVKASIEDQTNRWNWEFIYLGAEVSTFADAQAIGIQSAVRYAATGQSMRGTYAGVSRALTNSRGAGGQSVASSMPSFYDEEGNPVNS